MAATGVQPYLKRSAPKVLRQFRNEQGVDDAVGVDQEVD